MHPEGDEFVYLLEGDTLFDVKMPGQPAKTAHVHEPGSYVMVPKGAWHTARPNEPTTMLFVTPPRAGVSSGPFDGSPIAGASPGFARLEDAAVLIIAELVDPVGPLIHGNPPCLGVARPAGLGTTGAAWSPSVHRVPRSIQHARIPCLPT